jgi:hypothetical protein
MTVKDVEVKLTLKKKLSANDEEMSLFYNTLFNRVKDKMKMVRMNRDYYLPTRAKKIPNHR